MQEILTIQQLKELDEVYKGDENSKKVHADLLRKQALLPIGIRYACRNWMFMPVDVAKPGDIVREDNGYDDVEWQIGERVPAEEYACTLKKFNDTAADCFQIICCVGATLPPSASKMGVIRFNTAKFDTDTHTRRSQNPGEDCVCCKHFGFTTKTNQWCECPIEASQPCNQHRRHETAMDIAGD